MSSRYTDVDLMILKRWDEVNSLREAFDDLVDRMQGMIEGSLQKVAVVATEKGFSIFSMLPERMYHWTEKFVHSTPDNRWKQGRKHSTRPYIFISFGYDRLEAEEANAH